MTEKLLTVKEVAVLTGYREASVRDKILRREWEHVKLGQSVRIKESFIRALIEKGTVPAREKQAA